MSFIEEARFTLTTDGSGDVSSTTDTLQGIEVVAISVDYDATAAAGTDVTVSLSNPSSDILVLTNNNTDALHYPTVATSTEAGVARTDYVNNILVNGTITATIAQGGASKTSTITVYYRRLFG